MVRHRWVALAGLFVGIAVVGFGQLLLMAASLSVWIDIDGAGLNVDKAEPWLLANIAAPIVSGVFAINVAERRGFRRWQIAAVPLLTMLIAQLIGYGALYSLAGQVS